MPDKSNNSNSSKTSPSKSPQKSKLPLFIGGAAVLGLAALDGGLVTVGAMAALGIGTYYVTDKALQASFEGTIKGDNSKFCQDFQFTRKMVAGCCGVATFLNPFIGIPGTALVIIGWMTYKGQMFALVEEREKERKAAAQEQS